MSVQEVHGKFRAETWLGKSRKRGPLRETRKEAQMDDAQNLLELGGAPKADTITVERALGMHFARKQFLWETATVNKYKRARSHLPATFEALTLDQVTPKVYRRAIESIESKHYRRDASQLLSGAFRLAIENELMTVNPCSVVSVPQPQSPEVNPPDPEQVKKIIAAAAEEVRTFLHFIAVTGVRKQEACALRWSDLRGNQLTVRSAVKADGKVRSVKQGRKGERTFALDVDTVAKLDKLPKAGPFMFGGEAPVKLATAAQWMERASRRAGFTQPVKDSETKVRGAFGLHDLRHFFASQLLASGRDVTAVAGLLGDSVAVVQRTYAHWIKRDDEDSTFMAGLLA